MPTYDYICEECGHEMEVFHAMGETIKKCPKCNKNKLKKKIGPIGGVIFKGQGWTPKSDKSYEQYRV